jgi:hypothetical protein
MKSVYAKLVRVQAELKAPKNQTNKFGGYKYRSCEDILEAVKPLLAEHCLALTISDQAVQVGERHYIESIATLVCTETAEQITTSAVARESEARKGMDDSQLTGSTSSYCRKYLLGGLFLIDDTKDADTRAPDDNSKQVTEIKKVIKGLDQAKQDEVSAWVAKKYGSLEKMPSHTLESLAARLAG